MLREKINDGVKEAMKSQDKLRLSTLRLVNAAIKNADIEARGAGKEPLDDGALLALMQKMIKQREESVDLYEKGGRKELAAFSANSRFIPARSAAVMVHAVPCGWNVAWRVRVMVCRQSWRTSWTWSRWLQPTR